MASSLPRARFGGAVAGAFLGGLVLASAFDRTPFGYAQSPAKPSAQDVRSLAEQSNAFVSIAEHVTPSVVSISSERDRRVTSSTRDRTTPPGMEDFFRQFEPRQQQGAVETGGSGFIVSKDGYIMTNNHVVEGADRVTVTLTDRRVFPARVIGRDPTTDVAVIKIDGGSLPFVQLGNDEALRVGEWVVAIGNPLELDNTVTAGIVSAKGRSVPNLLDRNTPRSQGQGSLAITDFIQTDAAINPGNSGGPLVNIRGEVIGINSAIASPTGYYSGYGFAVPITLAKEVMDDIVRYGRVRRAVLGVGINSVTPNDAAAAGLKTISGVRVDSYSEGPARTAGLQIGDIITAIDGKPVDRVNTLQRVVRQHEPGETVEVTVQRFGEQRTFKVKLAEAPAERQVSQQDPQATPARTPAATSGKLGITFEPVSAALAREANIAPEQRGVRVTGVTTGGPAYERLFEGDIVTEILNPAPRRPVRSVADLQQAVDRLSAGQYVTLYVYDIRGQASRVVTLRVGE